MNGPLHDPHAHKRTDINQLLNPVTPSSAIDHGLPHPPSSYANGHYPQNGTYTHPPMPPPPHQGGVNGTAYKLNPASWGDGTDHHRQRLDNMPLQRGYAPGAVPYPDFHSHVPRTHEDGLSEASVSVWPSPPGRLEAGYGSPSYSDERTSKFLLWPRNLLSNQFFSTPAMPNDTSTTAASSPYPSRPDSATYHHPDLQQVAFSQRPPQGVAGKRPYLSTFPSPLILTSIRRMATPWPLSCHPHGARANGPSRRTISTHATPSLLATSCILLSNTTPGHALFVYRTSISAAATVVIST
jgi:hypothetical protein